MNGRAHPEQAERERLAALYAGMDPALAAQLVEMDLCRWRDARDRHAVAESAQAGIDAAWNAATESERTAFLRVYRSEPVAARELARTRRPGDLTGVRPSIASHFTQSPRGRW